MDIDLDFVPNLPREETMSAREAVSDIIRRYMSEQGYSLSDASRFSHSLDAFHYNYINAAGKGERTMRYTMICKQHRHEEERCWFCQERYIVMPVLEKQILQNIELNRIII